MSPSHLVLIAENVNLRCGSATKEWRYTRSVFRVPCSVFRVPCSVFRGRKVFGYKSISRTPTSDIESFVGWSLSGRATSGLKSPSHLVLIAENVNLRCGSATKGWRYPIRIPCSAFRVSHFWSERLPVQVNWMELLFLLLASYLLLSYLLLVALPLLILNYLWVER